MSESKRCSVCQEIKPLGEFHRCTSFPDGRQYVCKQCRAEAARLTRPAARARQARYREANRDRLRDTNREYARQRYADDPEAGRQRTNAQNAALRVVVFAHYGQVCECCGTSERLTIDHLNGDGAEHRQELFGRQQGGGPFYRWLINQGFPEGYGVLCQPCNKSKDRGGRCRLAH